MIEDMPKLKSPFKRQLVKGEYIVTPEVEEGYEWVFRDEEVMAIEKLHGTNVSIVVKEGVITSIWNRTARIPFFNKGKAFIVKGLLESYDCGYCELEDGQWFGELIGPKINGNPYHLETPLWIPFKTYGVKHLQYNSWGKYPKDFESISNWFKDDLFSLFNRRRKTNSEFVEGVVFTHPDGRMAKLRRDMFPWYEGRRHGGGR